MATRLWESNLTQKVKQLMRRYLSKVLVWSTSCTNFVIAARVYLISLYTLSFFCSNYSYDKYAITSRSIVSLFEKLLKKLPQPVRPFDQPPATIHRICSDRVQKRNNAVIFIRHYVRIRRTILTKLFGCLSRLVKNSFLS